MNLAKNRRIERQAEIDLKNRGASPNSEKEQASVTGKTGSRLKTQKETPRPIPSESSKKENNSKKKVNQEEQDINSLENDESDSLIEDSEPPKEIDTNEAEENDNPTTDVVDPEENIELKISQKNVAINEKQQITPKRKKPSSEAQNLETLSSTF